MEQQFKAFFQLQIRFIIKGNIHPKQQFMKEKKQLNEYITEIEKQANVRSHFERQQQFYLSDINMAIYIDLHDIEKLKVFDIITTNNRQDFVVTFYSFRMELDDDTIEKLYKLFIRQMDNLLRNQTKRKYYLIFFDSPYQNKNTFDIFKEIFRRLPVIYFVKLNKIFHVNPSFLTKTFESINFTAFSRLFHKYFQYVEDAQSLQEISELKIFNILVKCPKQITRGITIQSQNPQVIRSAMLDSKKQKPFNFLRKQLKEYPIDRQRKIPIIILSLIETMKQCKQLCLLQGIFRIAASIEDEEELLDQILDYKTVKLIDCQTHNKRAIAGLMKKVFTESTTPLIPYLIYNRLLNQKIDENNISEYWKLILIQLPRLNKNILCYVTQFLREYILKNRVENKMNSHNLAVVFNPCFFRAKQSSIADLMNSGKFAGLFKWWLQNYDQVMKSMGDPSQTLLTQNRRQNKEQRKEQQSQAIKYRSEISLQKIKQKSENFY